MDGAESSDHGNNEVFADKDRGYDGTRAPVKLQDIVHGDGSVVVVGKLQSDGHMISAEGRGVIVIDPAPTANDES